MQILWELSSCCIIQVVRHLYGQYSSASAQLISCTLPTGTEFVRPVVGYFCSLCNAIYASEEEAKDEHCRTPMHHQKLKANLHRLLICMLILHIYLQCDSNYTRLTCVLIFFLLGTQGAFNMKYELSR